MNLKISLTCCQKPLDSYFVQMKISILIESFAFVILLFGVISMTAQNKPYQPNGEIDSLRLADGIFLFRSNSKTGNPNAVSFIGKDGVFLEGGVNRICSTSECRSVGDGSAPGR